MPRRKNVEAGTAIEEEAAAPFKKKPAPRKKPASDPSEAETAAKPPRKKKMPGTEEAAAIPAVVPVSAGRAPDEVSLEYGFIGELSRAMKTGRSRSIALSGNVQDLFYAKTKDSYLPLVQLLIDRFTFKNTTNIGGQDVRLCLIHLSLNDGVRFLNGCETEVIKMFVTWQIGLNQVENLPAAPAPPPEPARPARSSSSNPAAGTFRPPAPRIADPQTEIDKRKKAIVETIYKQLQEARNNNSTALQICRRLVEASQAVGDGPRLMIFIEGGDLIVPAGGDIASANQTLTRKLQILEDWFKDPEFMEGKSTVVMLSDSLPAIHERVTRIPQFINLEVAAPDDTARKHFIRHFYEKRAKEPQNPVDQLATETAGLSLHSIRQLLISHDGPIPSKAITEQQGIFIKSQLGDAMKFYRPNHKLADLKGCRKFKDWAVKRLLPRLRSHGKGALPAMIVGGAIRSGKTFRFEAVAAELECPVCELGNIRSQWYGGTDVILDKLERLLQVMPKMVMILDEADTVLGGVGKDVHETERRLTGKIQALISNPRFLGKITWILMTARIDQLSADIRGEGRGGDLIIPILDPDSTDRKEYIEWMLESAKEGEINDENRDHVVEELVHQTDGWYAGRFSAVGRALAAEADIKGEALSLDEIKWIFNDLLVPDVKNVRRYQTLQALLNCTSRSLLPEEYQIGDIEEHRGNWMSEIAELRKML